MIDRVIIYFLLLASTIILASCNYCKVAEKRENEEVIGIVNSKMKLEWSRGEQTIVYQNQYDQIKHFEIMGDNSGFYDFVDKGDSLHKPLNVKKIEVYRKGILERDFLLNISCNN